MKDRDHGGDEPTVPRSRLEDEVLEILVRADQPTSLRDHVRRKAQQRRRTQLTAFTQSLPRLNTAGPGTFLVACLVLAFLAMLVRDSSALLATLLAIASSASLVMIWVRRYGAGGRADVKTWRGRDIDLAPPSPAWVDSLRDRFRRPPRK
jgi:hypothetical protein